MNLIDDNTFELLRDNIDYSELSVNQQLMSDSDLKYPLERYLILSHYSDKFSNVKPIQLYYNKYYWFTKLNREYLRKFGNDDLNLRQEGFKILE